MSGRENFDFRDVVQISVGSFIGALSYVFDAWEIAFQLAAVNVALIIILSVSLSIVISYWIGVRRMGNKKIQMLGFLPLRTVVHYSTAVIFSLLILILFNLVNVQTPWQLSVKRTVLLALPATVLGSAVDLLGSRQSG